MLQSGVIILCHGSRGRRGIIEVPETVKRIADGVKPLLPPGVEVIGAALQFNHPTVAEAVKSLAADGIHRIVIMPYFLFSGRHITEDIPQLVEELKRTYPKKQFIVAKPLGLDAHFIGQVVRCIEEATPELWSNMPISPIPPEAIEQQSMDIVERLLPPTLQISRDERLVVKRIVHASGDAQVATLIKFSPSAIPDGLSAIAKGSPIFTDVRMVASGINRHLAEACGCFISCAMDEIKGQMQVDKQNITRAAAGMRHLGNRLDEAVVAIGNAPTALTTLLELIDNDGMKPALIVGMPVGFVQAKESKDELMKRNVPYITAVGTRGGSAMAAAAVNALLKIAVERNSRDQICSTKGRGVVKR
jgi:precorrin-8X/cobalt-precorrin-8 methylmutase